jgi:hypothetical protein
MQQNNPAFPLMISVVVMDPNQLRSVYALLGGAAIAVAQSAPQGNAIGSTTVAAPTPAVEQSASGAEASPAAVTTGGDNAPADSGEVDAHGHPWSADLHASTKTKTKEGLWRMKPGVSRPDPLPGFPVDTGTGTSSETQAPSATSPAATAPESAPPATAPEAPAEDDEFAAFRAAAATSEATDAAAAASVPARQYSDADLGALCNQAAVKLGDPNPVKEIIARFTPEGVVAHSRNIPEESRTEFVKEVEAKAGIEFAG